MATFSAEHCPAFMAEEVAATWQEFQDYQDLRVLEIGMDLAYFKHLRYLGDSLDHPDSEAVGGRDHWLLQCDYS